MSMTVGVSVQRRFHDIIQNKAPETKIVRGRRIGTVSNAAQTSTGSPGGVENIIPRKAR